MKKNEKSLVIIICVLIMLCIIFISYAMYYNIKGKESEEKAYMEVHGYKIGTDIKIKLLEYDIETLQKELKECADKNYYRKKIIKIERLLEDK